MKNLITGETEILFTVYRRLRVFGALRETTGEEAIGLALVVQDLSVPRVSQQTPEARKLGERKLLQKKVTTST